MTNKEIRDMAIGFKSMYQGTDPELELAQATIQVTDVNEIYHSALTKLLGMLLPYDKDGKMNVTVNVVNEALDQAEEILK